MHKKKWIAALVLCAVLLMGAAPAQVMLWQFGDNGLTAYLDAADGTDIYPVLIAIDLAQGRDITSPQKDTLRYNAAMLADCETRAAMLDKLGPTLRAKVETQLARLSYLESVVENKRFPFLSSVSVSYWNDWGQDRTYGGERTHEGTDLMCDWGVPIYSTCDGVIEKVGWNTLGGWRIGVRGDSDGLYVYYAHLSSYYENISVGAKVTKGQLLGFVGDTGYGPTSTSGIMAPHLHYGLYEGAVMRAVNAYPLLRHWQKAA